MRVAVIGAGAIARRGHLPALKKLDGVEVRAVVDADEDLAKKVAREFNVPHWFSSCEEALERECLDLVDICTPPTVRLPMIEAAAAAGKHVLVEKPLALSVQEGIRICEVASTYGVKLNVVTNYRYFPTVLRAKRRISGQRIGRIVTMHSLGCGGFPSDQTRSTWLYNEGGVLFDFGPHVVDLLLWFARAPVTRVAAFGGDLTGGDMGFPTFAQLLIEFENGLVATVDLSWVTGIFRFTVEVRGTGGHICLDVRNDASLELRCFHTPIDDARAFFRRVLGISKGVVDGTYFSGALLFYPVLIKKFIDSIRSGSRPPSPGEQGLAVVAVLEAAQKSIREGRPVFLEELFPQHSLYDSVRQAFGGERP